MHEMPVTQTILNMVLKHAGDRRVTDVYLQVGQMSAIVPASVEIFFDYLSRDTLAAGARLHFEILPITITCVDCGSQVDLSQWATQPVQVVIREAFGQGCQCGSRNLHISDGIGCDLVSIAVEAER